MANEENLIPINQRPENEQREMRQKAGVNSGKTRRKKRDMKACMDLLLSLPAGTQTDYELLAELGMSFESLSQTEINNMFIVNAALMRNAKDGDVASIKELRSIIQDDAYTKHKIKMDKEKLRLEREKLFPEEPKTETEIKKQRRGGLFATLEGDDNEI